MTPQLKIWAYMGAFLAFLAALAFSYYQGSTRMQEFLEAKHSATLARIDSENRAGLAMALKAARMQEQEEAAKVAAIDKRLIESLRNENRKKNAAIADLRAGTIQLRERFTCGDTGTNSGVPSEAGTTSSSDAAQAGGLQHQDAEFLVQLAAEADEVVLQLQACQALVK